MLFIDAANLNPPSSQAEGPSLDEAPSKSSGAVERRSPSPPCIRCGVCNKKLGLIEQGIVCACGGNFCNYHRYTDRHECTFDYQADGRERLRKANPTVTSEKLRKI
ncbi:unnamed protein product [Mesocestoides corti]|uniref:AN1-type domain-containing protein n=1 Tax=Mesocestoides corti TaxID=53468 RepID=A0A0R3U5Q7_MESCO|nr:unnamed protein product [Mesocestoides corti]